MVSLSPSMIFVFILNICLYDTNVYLDLSNDLHDTDTNFYQMRISAYVQWNDQNRFATLLRSNKLMFSRNAILDLSSKKPCIAVSRQYILMFVIEIHDKHHVTYMEFEYFASRLFSL